MMPNRQEHQQEVHAFLKDRLSSDDWLFSIPPGSGMETYFVHGKREDYFVKVGARLERYLVMAQLGLTPQLVIFGQLEDNSSILVQRYIAGRKPSRVDYRDHLQDVANVIQKMHHYVPLKEAIQPAASNSYKDAGLRALDNLRQKWEIYQAQVPSVAAFIEHSLDQLAQQTGKFSGEGLVASHGDICNANWLFAEDGNIYLVDFESIAMDDPAFDTGALLWWYYPPELRQRFLDIAGYPYSDEFRFRMQIRMAMHCLSITLPRVQSFDIFNPDEFAESLTDFRAILNGEENPQGYAR